MKQTTRNNYRVEVTPEEPWLWRNEPGPDRHRQWMQRCESLVTDLRRHCDGVAGVTINYDTEETCSHCGRLWEDKPECCNAAIEEWDPSCGTEVQP